MIARDSALLWIGIIGGIVIYLTGTKPVWEWGYYEWLAAVGYAVSVISAKLGNSPLPGKNDNARVDPKKYIGAFVALYLLAGSVACAPKTKHVLVTADAAIYETLKEISDTEIALSSAGVLSPDQSKKINQTLLPVVRTGKELNDVLGAWNGSTPMPSQIPRLVKEIAELLNQVLAVLPDSPAKAAMLESISRAQQAALGLLLIMGQAR